MVRRAQREELLRNSISFLFRYLRAQSNYPLTFRDIIEPGCLAAKPLLAASVAGCGDSWILSGPHGGQPRMGLVSSFPEQPTLIAFVPAAPRTSLGLSRSDSTVTRAAIGRAVEDRRGVKWGESTTRVTEPLAQRVEYLWGSYVCKETAAPADHLLQLRLLRLQRGGSPSWPTLQRTYIIIVRLRLKRKTRDVRGSYISRPRGFFGSSERQLRNGSYEGWEQRVDNSTKAIEMHAA
ncbi:hypothetical protein KM043_014208 [Ampulex compressa]|nr:hypothetical protein KM043_014208 [Ampulex compressa]